MTEPRKSCRWWVFQICQKTVLIVAALFVAVLIYRLFNLALTDNAVENLLLSDPSLEQFKNEFGLKDQQLLLGMIFLHMIMMAINVIGFLGALFKNRLLAINYAITCVLVVLINITSALHSVQRFVLTTLEVILAIAAIAFAYELKTFGNKSPQRKTTRVNTNGNNNNNNNNNNKNNNHQLHSKPKDVNNNNNNNNNNV